MSDEQKDNLTNTPKPEALSVQTSDSSEQSLPTGGDSAPGNSELLRSALQPQKRATYRPSHKATFVGLSVVAVILIINAVIVAFVMRDNSSAEDEAAKQGVTLSAETLNKLGVDRNPLGNAKTELTIGPSTKFNNSVIMAADVNVAGKLTLNSKFTASEASVSKLEAGDTSIGQLNVNGDGTITSLNLRRDLIVAGNSRLQGPVTMTGLVTINNSVNIAGSLSVGGALSVKDFQVNTLTVGSHIITRGNAPGVSAGGGIGSNGTVSISGNDASGTVAVNTGVGATGGLLATVTFQTKYGSTPHVVVTAVGRGVDGLFINRTSAGFSINSSGALAPGGYAFDYIIMQ